ncbi:putative DNA repair protein rad-5, partial [Aureobasidium melanogenum]
MDERPNKKRRFFADKDSTQDASFASDPSGPDEVNSLNENDRNATATTQTGQESTPSVNRFDSSLFQAFVGNDAPQATINALQRICGNDVERAVNMYLDGSWQNHPLISNVASPGPRPSRPKVKDTPPTSTQNTDIPKVNLAAMPTKRYIGAMGVIGWTTRSGTGIITSGEKIKIERARPSQQKVGKGGKSRASTRQDVIVRFTNAKGEEVGRLEQDSAAWISTLMDQNICHFEGHCVFAPDRVRTNDTVYLQLRCFFLKSCFSAGSLIKPLDNNRETGLYEAKETRDEKDLRLRQVGLVKLFSEINLHPSRANSATEKHKREGILRAAEMPEQPEQSTAKPAKSSDQAASSPPSDDAEDGQELEQDQLDSLYKKAQSFDFNTPVMQPAETFVLDLRKYQKQALHWMVGKERDQNSDHKEVSMHPLWEEYLWPTKDADDAPVPQVEDQSNFYVNPYSGELSLDFPVQEQNCLGGILADEMGLGKTIEMLSLIHTHTSEFGLQGAKMSTVMDLPRSPKSSSGVARAPCTTLVVAPMSLLAQWQSEAEKASKPGTLKTLVYYGSDKNVNLKTLCCEANAASAPNVIITSYGTVLSEYNQVVAAGGDRGSSGGLFSLDYFRVILDEAHMIKNRQSKTARACYEIAAEHRWTLTGTPIVNRLEDLFSLVRFLRVEPWSNFSFWKTFITVPFESKDYVRALDVVQTVLEPLVLRRTKDMKTPDGEALVPLPPRTIDIQKIELSKVERDLYDHIFARAKRTFAANVEAGTLMKSYTTIFAQILRLRQSCCHPTLVRSKGIGADEEDAEAAADIANGLADDMDLQSLIQRFESEAEEEDASRFGANVLKQIQAESNHECPICFEEPMEEQSVTGCWHSACKKCLLDLIENATNKNELPLCFNCREPINARDIFEVIRHDDDDDDEEAGVAKDKSQNSFEDIYTTTQPSDSTDSQQRLPRVSLRRVNTLSSAKIGALLTHLKRIKKASPTTKSVIFSQFTSFLDILEPALDGASIPYLRFDGSMAQKARAAVLSDFANRTKGCVLLLSLKAGGVGLNLTCASNVFMMDPWWSWAVESQAIDRVHRMGQTQEVKIVRFVVDQSIEEKMLRVQDRKKFIASSLGMMNEDQKKLQRIEDIKELLS